MTPRITVIIPSYNAREFLPGALESIRAQEMAALEILIVDDGSTDGTAEWAAAQEGVRVIRQENAGPSAARNRGLAEARGEYIAFLDADDLWPAYKLRVQADWLDRNPELEVVLGLIRWESLNGAPLPQFVYELPDQTRTFINLGAALWRRTAFDRVGGLCEEMRYGEDHDWFLRAREEELPMVILRDVTLHYRLHGANMTANRGGAELGIMQVLRRSLLRRRARGGEMREIPTWASLEELAQPSISVVIPVYNGVKYLGAALDSVLAQTVPPLEVLVVDDGSEDGSAELAESYPAPVRVLRRPHRGLAATRNAGCQAARGSLMAFLDADDLWHPQKLEAQLAALRADPQADIAFTLLEQFDDATGAVRPPQPGAGASACVFRRSVWLRTGPFNETLRIGEFIDWIARAREQGLRQVMVEQVLARRRIHANNTTRQMGERATDYARLAKAALDRRRNGAS